MLRSEKLKKPTNKDTKGNNRKQSKQSKNSKDKAFFAAKQKAKIFTAETKELFTLQKILMIFLGTGILSFGIYNIHQQTQVTEGGVLGLILLINHWFGISSSTVAPILDILCYLFAFQYLGKDFIKISIVSTLSLSGFLRLWEQFPPILPNLSAYPLLAAVLGGIFVGVGGGIVVRQGGSSGGDDALALSISKLFKCRISKAYLATDITVLFLSLSYIPVKRIAFSLVTVFISSYLIDFIEMIGKNKDTTEETLPEKAVEPAHKKAAILREMTPAKKSETPSKVKAVDYAGMPPAEKRKI